MPSKPDKILDIFVWPSVTEPDRTAVKIIAIEAENRQKIILNLSRDEAYLLALKIGAR